MIKSQFKALRTVNRELILEETIDAVFLNGNAFSEECSNFFNHMRKYLEKAR